jgi:glycosyltransferase involved in cell wall biosynthesis
MEQLRTNEIVNYPSLVQSERSADRAAFNDARKQSKIIVIIPAYNEDRFIGSVVLKTRQFADEVIVIDDGSKDSTAELAQCAGARVVRHETNLGKGEALKTAFTLIRHEYAPQVVVTIDADWQHAPEEVPIIIRPILAGKADLVIGTRYLQKTSDVPLKRVVGHWAFNMLINTVSGTRLTDSQSGYRAFSSHAVDCVNFNSKGFSVESEMQFWAADYRLKVVEVPITIRYIDKPKRSVVSHGFKVLNGILRLVAQTRPLLFFTLPGMLILSVGVTVGLWVIYSYSLSQSLAIGTALLAMLFSLIGLLALFTGITLHTIRSLLLEFVRPAGG